MDIYSIGLKVDSRQVKTAKTDLDRFGKASKKTESSVGKLGKAVAGLAASFSALEVLRRSLRTMMDFSKAMSGVEAVTRATASELAIMEERARELGATTQFSATQAAGGFEFLGMAGFSASESVEAIGDVLSLAAASGMDLARSADIASNILSGFGLEAREAGRMADVLALAASSANTNVEQLGNAMQFVAPVAATLGISVEESTAAIGALSNAGIQGQKAGTGLRRVLIQLIKPTTDAQKALASYGLSLEDVDPSVRNFTDILETLNNKNISAKDSAVIFGAEGVSAYQALAGQISGIRELNSALDEAAGSAQEMADVRTDNLVGDLQDLNSAFSELQIALLGGEPEEAMRSLVQSATELTRALADSADAIKTVITFASTLTAIKLASWAYGSAAGLRAITSAGAILTGPAGLLALLATGAFQIGNEFLRARQETERFGDALNELSASQMRNELEVLQEELFRMRTAEMRDPEFFMTDNQREKIRLTKERIEELKSALTDLSSESNTVRLDPVVVTATPEQGQGGGNAEEISKIVDNFNSLEASMNPIVEAAQNYASNMTVVQKALDANVISAEKAREIADKLDQEYDKATRSARGLEGSLQDIAESMTNDVSNGLTDIIMQARSAEEVFASLAKQIARTIIQQQIADPLAESITGFATQAIGTAFGAGGGGGFQGVGNATPRQFANGGNVFGETPAIVGERGPELFVPRQDGQIVPNHQMGGGGNVTVNVINQGGEQLEAQQQSSRRGPNGEQTVDVMVKSSIERLDGQGQLDGVFRRHGAARQGQF